MTRISNLAAALALATCLLAPASGAPLLPQAHVVVESDDEANLRCSALNARAGKVVERELRARGTRMVAEPQPGVPAAWVSVTAIDLGERCAVSFSLQFFLVQPLSFPRGMIVEAPGEYCLLGGLMEWNKAGLQSQLDRRFEALTEECLSKIEHRLKGSAGVRSRSAFVLAG